MADVTLLDLSNGNSPVDVSAEDAAAGYLSGRYAVPSSTAELQVVSPTGKVGTIDANRVNDALKLGYRFASKHERLAKEAENQPLRSAVEAGLSELTLGTSDVALKGMGVEGLAERRDTGVGQVAKYGAMGATMLASGGLAGLATQAGKAAVLKTATGAALGEATEAAAKAALQKVIQNRAGAEAVANGLGRAVTSGAEGALFGAGAELSEQALGPDTGYNAERILAAGGMGALLGGGLETGLGVVRGARAARASNASKARFGKNAALAGTPEAADDIRAFARDAGGVVNLTDDELRAVVERKYGEPLSDEGAGFLKRVYGKLKDSTRSVAAAMSGRDPELLKELGSKANQQVIREGRDGLEAVGRNFTDELNQVRARSQEDASLAFGRLRPELRNQAIQRGDAPGMLAAAGDALDGLSAQLDDFVRAAPGMTRDQAEASVAWVREGIKKARKAAFDESGVAEGFQRRIQREVEVPGTAPQRSLEDQVHQAAFDLAGERKRVRFADIEARLPGVPRAQLHKAYDALQDRGDAVLMRIDDPLDITAADEAARQLVGARAPKLDKLPPGPNGGLGDDRVWIDDVMAATGLTPEKLFELRRAGKIRMGRVDMPQLYGVDKVAASTVEDGAAMLHWIDRAGLKEIEKAATKGEPRHIMYLERAPKASAAPASSKVVETVTEPAVRRLQDLSNIPEANHVNAARRLYDELDTLKRYLAKPARFGDAGSDAAQADAAANIRRMYDQIKLHLEDDGVYGALGSAQREINEAAAARYKAVDELEKVIKFDGKGNADPASVAAFMGQLKSMRGDRAVAALDSFAEAESRFAAAAEKHLGGQFRARSDESLKRLARVRHDLEHKVRVVNIVDDMVKQENQMLGGGMMLGGGLAGFLYGGPLGAAVGTVGAELLRPGRMLKMNAHLGAAMDRVGQLTREKARNLTLPKLPVPSEDTMKRGLSRATITMLDPTATQAEREEAYAARTAELDNLSDPYAFHRHTARTLSDVEHSAPAHAVATSLKAAEAVSFLRSAYPMPKPGTGGVQDPLNPEPPRPTPTAADIERFARLDAAVQNPMRVLDDPHVTRAEVEAVERVYPGWTRQARAAVLDAVAVRGKALPAAARRRAARILGLPEFNAGNLPKWQARFEPNAVPGTPGVATPRTSKNPRSASLMPTSDAVLVRESRRR